jgi:hypothetical protein
MATRKLGTRDLRVGTGGRGGGGRRRASLQVGTLRMERPAESSRGYARFDAVRRHKVMVVPWLFITRGDRRRRGRLPLVPAK